MRVLGSALANDEVLSLSYSQGWYCALLADAWRKYIKVGADGVSRVVLVCPYDTLDPDRTTNKAAVLASYPNCDVVPKKPLTEGGNEAHTTTQSDTTTEDKTS